MEMRIGFPGGFRIDAKFKGHTVTTDQSVEAGGEGAEPSPFDLFLASIGTCTGYYILAFCRKREIPTEGLELRLRAEREGDGKLVTRIRIEVLLPEGFPSRYAEACLRAAGQCTVKRHLEAPPRIDLALAGETT